MTIAHVPSPEFVERLRREEKARYDVHRRICRLEQYLGLTVMRIADGPQFMDFEGRMRRVEEAAARVATRETV